MKKLELKKILNIRKSGDYTLKYPINSKNPVIKKTVKAKDLWDIIVKSARDNAEPGLIFWDKQHWYSTSSVYPQFKNISTNPCVVGETKILTDKGYLRIDSIINTEVNVFNGFEFSKVVPKITGENQSILKITLDNGSVLRCTKYHEFLLWEGFFTQEIKIKAHELKIGDNIPYVSEENDNCITKSTIISIEDDGISELVYCFNEPLKHLGVFNGFLTGQCAEIAMGSDSCRLIALNLFGCIVNAFKKDAYFDYDKFYKVVYEAQRLMDDLVDLELKCVEDILGKIEKDPEPEYIKDVERRTWETLHKTGKEGRRTGLGFTALADTIASLGIKFDSTEGLEVIEKIMKTKCEAEFDSSIDMAIERGQFKGFDPKIEETSHFVQMLKIELPVVYERMMKYGRRNVSISTVAPNGSLSIVGQTSSGVEPVFMLSYKRRKKVNPSDKDARVDFTDPMGDKWQEFEIVHPKLKIWREATGKQNVEESPYFGSTAEEIDWVKRVKIQSIVQKYITHSISSTINLPETVTNEKVGEIYMKSWEMGLKGITVYRAGSRSGVMISNEEKKKIKTDKFFSENHAPKRPKSLEADVIRFVNGGEKWIGFVGLLDGRPYEIFTGLSDNFQIPSHVESGKIPKRKIINKKGEKVSKYDFVFTDKNGEEVVVEGLNETFNPEYWNYAKMISGVLRHGMPLPFAVTFVSDLNLGGDMLNTWKAGVARMIKKYIADGTKGKDTKCPECGADDGLVFEEGCLKCKNCGFGKC